MTTYLRSFDYDKAFDYYCNLIAKMRQGSNAKSHSQIIAKPVLVLSIIKLIEEGKTVNKFSTQSMLASTRNFGFWEKNLVIWREKSIFAAELQI